jgi:hypothetical protein
VRSVAESLTRSEGLSGAVNRHRGAEDAAMRDPAER